MSELKLNTSSKGVAGDQGIPRPISSLNVPTLARSADQLRPLRGTGSLKKDGASERRLAEKLEAAGNTSEPPCSDKWGAVGR